MKAVWKFLRSILKALLVMLPISIVGTIYMNRDYMNPDGILLWWEYLTRDEVPEATLPADWGHDTIPPPNPHILEVVPLLRTGDYAGLEALYKRDPDAFNYFRDTTPDLADALDTWVGAQPRSALALVARGHYWYFRGWNRRGLAFISKTSRAQLRDMHRAFRRADADYIAAIAIDPTAKPAYRRLIGIYAATNRDDAQFAIWRQAIAAGQRTTKLHKALFNALVPWWSGLTGSQSTETIRAIVDEIDTGELQRTGDPVLLRGFPDWVEAEVLWRSGARSASLEKFKTFIDGPSGLHFLDNYARHLAQERRMAEALTYYVRSLRSEPSFTGVLEDYGRLLTRLKRYGEAQEILDRALSLDPYDPDILLKRATLNMILGDLSAARLDFERAQIYGVEKAASSADSGLLTVRDHKDLPTAAAYYRSLIAKAPERTNTHYSLGTVLDQLQDCGAIPAYRRYAELCDKNGNCSDYSVRWTKVRWKGLVDRRICSIDGFRVDPTVWLPTKSN